MQREYTEDQKHELRIRFLAAALAGVAESGARKIYESLSEKQRKQPELASAIMADRLARSAVYVLTTPPENGKGDGTWGQ